MISEVQIPPMKFTFHILFTLVLLPLAFSARAAMTPAGTIIRNHAIIRFQRDDDSGRVFDAPSNEVLLEVLPVYGLEILPDGDSRPGGTPGQSQRLLSTSPNALAVFAYTLFFTGNSDDNAIILPAFDHQASDFLPRLPDGDTGLLVYCDSNINGLVDPDDVLIASWRDANGNGKIELSELQGEGLGRMVAPGLQVDLLLAFRVPEGLPLGARAYVGIEGSSVGDPGLKDPTGPGAVQNISEAIVIDDAVMTLSKSANLAEAAPGETITYTLSAKSSGSSDALGRSLTVDGLTNSHRGIVVFDLIPKIAETGLLVPFSNPQIIALPSGVSASFIYSSQENTHLDIGDPSWNWHSTYETSDTVLALITSDGISHYDIPPGQELKFSFEAYVPIEAYDQSLINQAYVSYDTNSLGIQTVKATNDLFTKITGTAGVLIRDTDFESHRPPLTPEDDEVSDEQTVNVAQAGRFVYFTNRILNLGGRVDSFNISLDPSTVNPNNWTVSFFKSDGITPLHDTGVDGVIDSGPILPAGADINNPLDFVDIVLRVEVPEGAEPGAVPPEARFIVKASSERNASHSDTTANQILALQAAAMRLDNHYPIGSQTQESDAWRQAGDPGTYVDFPLIVQNLAPPGGEVDVYTLSSTVLPQGWSLTYYRDLNQDGVLQPGELLPVLRSGEVAAQEKDYLIARINIDPYAVADANEDGLQDLHTLRFRATSSNLPGLYDEQDDEVVVNWQNRFELSANRQGTIEAGGVTLYTHTVTNHGERANRFYLTLTPGSANWTYFLLQEDSGDQLPMDIDPSDGVSKHYIDLDQAGGANDSGNFRLRLYVPGGTPQGTLDISSILVSANDPDSPTAALERQAQHLVSDVTQVIAGDLVLFKSAQPPPQVPVNPGDSITYTTSFFNKAAAPLAELAILDQISGHSIYVQQSLSVDLPLPDGLSAVSMQVSRDGGLSWSSDNGIGPDESITNVRAAFSGALAGGAEGKVQFQVIIK